ncbi:MAG: helix-turn-helix domain-containing protein [Chitinophagaceae bacterium]
MSIILTGLTLEDFFLRIEKIIETKIGNRVQTKTENQSEYITRKEVAELLKISLPTLHDWTKQGWLPSYKMGNRVLYKRSEIDACVTKVLFQKHKKSI